MIIGYSDYYAASPAAIVLSGSQTPAPAFLTSDGGMLMDDARTGTVTSLTMTGGTQSISVYTRLAVTLTSVLDAVPYWGVIGIANVQGLPAGTKIVFGGNGVTPSITQRLAPNDRGELGAWAIGGLTISGATNWITIYNDVNGSASLPAASAIGIGEFFVGKAIYLPSLVESAIADDLLDISQYNRSNGQQLYQLMRKPWREMSQTMGRFTVAQGEGKGQSALPDGSGSVIDLQTLRAQLVVARKCAVCDVPSQGFAGITTGLTNGFKVDTTMMQASWMVARMTSAGKLSLDSTTRYTWNPTFQEAL